MNRRDSLECPDIWKSRSGTFYFDLFFEPLIEWGLKHFNPPLKAHTLLLDLGCGGGDKTDIFRTAGAYAVGIDISSEAVEYARQTYPRTPFITGDIQDLPFGGASFDFVFSHSVLQYVDWPQVIRECHRVMKPGAKAIFIENLGGHPLARSYRLIHRCLRWKYMAHRTPRSHLTLSQCGAFHDVFSRVEVKAFHLTTPVLLTLPAIMHGLLGSSMRLHQERTFRFLNRLDTWLLARLPHLDKYGWIAVIRATK
jgi:SAM-dependent methyltransferase